MRIKCLIILLTILYSLFSFSQNDTSKEVDSLLKKSLQSFSELKFIESSEIADKALNLSFESNYSKGIVMSKLYIAKVLLEIGLNMEALEYLEALKEESFFRRDIIPQVEAHRLAGRIYGSQRLFSLAKEEFNKQLLLSERITDPKKKELSKLWAYQNIEHLYSLQGINDSIETYQNLQEEQLKHFEEHEVFYNISTLYSSKGRLYLNRGEFDAAAVELQKSTDMLEKYSIPYTYYNLQIFGDLEAAKGSVDKAIYYYTKALENSVFLNATSTTLDIHKKMAEYMLTNDTLLNKAKKHRREYRVLNDSLEKYNNRVAEIVLQNIIKSKEEATARKTKVFRYTMLGLVLISIFLVTSLSFRNRVNKKKITKKNQQLTFTTDKIEQLEEELGNNIFNEIIELAKTNSPEFLPLFSEGYPDFVAAMKKLDPNIRSTELYFSALAYLNFSTKDIASYTYVTTRAVQIRKNRMRKKHNIPSEVDFNEWFRNLEIENILRN